MQLNEKELRLAYRRLTYRAERSECFSPGQLIDLARGDANAEFRKQALGHLLRCSDCAKELEVAFSLREWAEVSAGAAVSSPRRGAGSSTLALGDGGASTSALASWRRASWVQRLGMAGFVLLLLGTTIASLMLWLETRRLEGDLAVANQARGRATSIGASLDEANETVVELRGSLEVQERRIVELGEQIDDLSTPFANLPIIALDLRRVTRRDGVLPRQPVVVPTNARWFTLIVTLSAPADDGEFAVEVLNTNAETVWESRDLIKEGRGTFTLTFPTRLMRRGIFHLRFFSLGGGQRDLLEDLPIEMTTP